MYSLFILKLYSETSFRVFDYPPILFSRRRRRKKGKKEVSRVSLKFFTNFTRFPKSLPFRHAAQSKYGIQISVQPRRVVVTSSQDKLAISNRGLSSSSCSQYRVYPSIYVSIRIIRGDVSIYIYTFEGKKRREWNGRWRGGRIEIGSIERGQCEVVVVAAVEKSCAIP